jgi:hypothetical protein
MNAKNVEILKSLAKFMKEFFNDISSSLIEIIHVSMFYTFFFERPYCDGIGHPANVATCARMTFCPISFKFTEFFHILYGGAFLMRFFNIMQKHMLYKQSFTLIKSTGV